MERKFSSLVLALSLVLLPLVSFAAVPSFQSVTNIVDGMTYDLDFVTLGTNSQGQAAFGFINTNKFYLTELIPIASGDVSIAGNEYYLEGEWTRTNAYFYIPENLPTAPLAVIYKTNVAVGKEVWVINDLFLGVEAFWLTNDANPSVKPIGPWFPDTATLFDFLSVTITNKLYGTFVTTVTADYSMKSREALRTHDYPRNPALASRPLCWFAEVPVNVTIMLNDMAFLRASNLNALIDVFEIDRWTTNRNANNVQEFDSNAFPGGWTLAKFKTFCKTNGFKAGMHADFGLYGNGGYGSQPFYRTDATNFVLNGIDFILMDTTLRPVSSEKSKSDLVIEFAQEFRDASILYNNPVFIMSAAGGGFGFFYDWMPYFDTWYFAADNGSDGGYLTVLNQSHMWIGPGKYPVLANPDETFTTNTPCAQRLFGLLSIAPAHLQIYQTNFFTGSIFGVCTDEEMKSIWRDPSGNPGWIIATNASGSTWARMLSGGDMAIFFWNTTASSGTMTANWSDLKIGTNTVLYCRDVFEKTNTSATISLSRSVAAHGGSLWRLSLMNHYGTRTLSGAGSPQNIMPGNVGDTFRRTDSTGATYIKTNGTGTTGGWHNLLTGSNG